MGFRRLQKEETKKRTKDKFVSETEHTKDWKKPDKAFKKYKKVKWSGSGQSAD